MEVEENIWWVVRIIMLVFVTGFIIYLVGATRDLGTSTFGLEQEAYTARVIERLSFTDSTTGRYYSGMIDLSKFNEKTLEGEFNPKAREFGIKVSLTGIDGKKIEGAESFYYNKNEYEFVEPLTFSRPFVKRNTTHYVLVRDSKGAITQGKMNVVIVHREK